jgi:hypothetical protein
MAACTQGHEVLLVIRATLSGSIDVMDDRCRCHSSQPPAQLAEGMPVKESLARFPPGGAVAFVRAGIPLVALVGPRSLFRMLLAVPSFGQIGTTRMAARSLGLVGHKGYSFGQKGSPGCFPSSVWTCLSVQYRERLTEHNCYFLII